MKVYIERVTHWEINGKKKPTEFVDLTEEKLYKEITPPRFVPTKVRHVSSRWHTETEDLGSLLVGLESNEDSSLVFYTSGDIAYITIRDDYME